MKKTLGLIFATLLLTLGVAGQQPSSQTMPAFPVNATLVNGIAPGYAPTAGSGLTLNLSSGTAFCSGAVQTYAGGTLTMTASTTNYVYLSVSSSCAPATKTTAFTANDIPIAVIVAGSSTITTITDDRNMFVHGETRMCEVGWGGTGASNALQTGDDAVANSSCYNETGATQTITAVYCRSDVASNTTTLNPSYGASGSGTSILSGALTCGSSNAWSSTGTVTNASLANGNSIDPVMGGTLTGTSIHLLIVYTQP